MIVSRLALFAAAMLPSLLASASAQTVADEVSKRTPALLEFYKDFHANPELSLKEVRSAGILAAEAKKLGFRVTEKVGGTGVVAVLKNGAGQW